MISIPEFNEEFHTRHDFIYPDLDFLNMSYPDIQFNDIPEAWVCVIDTYLRKIEDISLVKSISQIFGFPIIDVLNVSDASESDKRALQGLQVAIELLDVDLHDQLGEGITQH
jgi:hypothetical protein